VNGTVARKLSRTRHVQDRFSGPFSGIRVKVTQPVLSLDVRGEIRQVHVVITVREQRIAYRFKRAWFIAAEVFGENQI
jgi:hypothetical protein